MFNDCALDIGNEWFRYKSAAIIIEDGCVLLAYNSYDNHYYLIGGKVQINESSEEAVRREVLDETGIYYDIDRLCIINENFFVGKSKSLNNLNCHELVFIYLMKSRGSKELDSDSYTLGVKEEMHWIPVNELDNYIVYPTFLKDYLEDMKDGILHLVTDEE